jgi:hypothetical protein
MTSCFCFIDHGVAIEGARMPLVDSRCRYKGPLNVVCCVG